MIAAVQRHRTAMVRHTLSKPVSLMVLHGLIRPGVTVFDYGSGQGDDLRGLTAAGVDASGWDPHFAPSVPLLSAQVVNLGFVLNVIEDEAERRDALTRAWSLATSCLCVSTMVAGQVPTDGLHPYRDGFLTARGTFQKYFLHSELRALIGDALGAEPVAVAPGIFLLFRRPEDQDDFLVMRRIGRRTSTRGYHPPARERAQGDGAGAPDAAERVAAALRDIAGFIRLRGRAPHPDELAPGGLDLLARGRVSVPRAVDLAIATELAPGELERSAAAMREDLLVHHALARLQRSVAATRPSATMARDVRVHFGNQRELADASTDYLKGLGDDAHVRQAIEAAAGVGALDGEGRLLLDAQRREELPGVLRVYLGCASYFAGEPDDDALVRIDPVRRRVAYMPLASRSDPFPETTGATLVDLKRQSVVASDVRRRLVTKSAILGARSAAQRKREKDYRLGHGLDPSTLMERL